MRPRTQKQPQVKKELCRVLDDVDVIFQGSHLFSEFSVPLKDRLNVPFLLQPFKANPFMLKLQFDTSKQGAILVLIYGNLSPRH